MAKKTVGAKGKTTKKADLKVGDLIPVSITKTEEHWNSYEFSDGTKMRTRSIIIEAARQHGVFDDKGNPIYNLTTGVLQQLNSPKRLKKGKK